ncbi:MAG: hypothetical protein ACI9JL_004389 [Paracoccaceae bacterium]|jgi:hypothetical protein
MEISTRFIDIAQFPRISDNKIDRKALLEKTFTP